MRLYVLKGHYSVKEDVKVWDIWVRIFHWGLVALILFSWLSAELGGNWMIWHTQAGFLTAGLIIFRLIWGFIGSSRARFNRFVKGPKAISDYARGLDNKHYLGHNPLGALGVVILLTLISLQVITGLFSNDDIFIEGPLAHLVSYDTSLALTDIHELIFNLIMLTVALHILAVVFYQRIRKQPLIQAMIHGRKPAIDTAKPTRFAPNWAVLAALTSSMAATVFLFWIS